MINSQELKDAKAQIETALQSSTTEIENMKYVARFTKTFVKLK